MSNSKKTTTKGGTQGKTKTGTGHADLAELLSAVLRHPDMPADLHTYIGDWLVSQPQESIDSPEYIRLALAHAGGKGARDERA